MAEDVFGDLSLFSEFDKERETERFLDDREKKNGQESSDDDEDMSSDENGGQKGDEKDDEPTEISASQQKKSKVELEGGMTQHRLLFERNKFQSFAKIIDTTRHVPDEEGPAVQVLYYNTNFSRKHRTDIENFIRHLMDQDQREEMQNGPQYLPKLNLRSTTPTSVDINGDLPTSKRTNEMWEGHAMIGNAQFHKQFMVDTRGWPITPNCQSQALVQELVLYEPMFETPLPVDEEDLRIIKREKKKRAACFNCDGEHNMSECPNPKNFAKISENRRKFQDMKVSSVPKLSLSKNYSDFEDDPRFKKFKPGQISDDLYAAMGIRNDVLPIYIYKMRVSGYPPGWLAQAKKAYSSGIAIFDKDGNETNLKGETLEDGEINGERVSEQVPEVELEKIIEYPGFTVPTPDNVLDESDRFNMPPLQPHQLKTTLAAHVTNQEALKKRKMEEVDEIEKKKIRLMNKEADMEMSDEDEDDTETSGGDSDFRPPFPVDTPPSKPPLPAGTPPMTPVNARSRHMYHPTIANLTPPHFSEGNPPIPDYTPPARPPLPDGTPPPTPPVDSSSLNRLHSVGSNSTRSGSPTFESLQNKYQDILKQLNEDDSSSQSDSDVKIIDPPNQSEDSDASVIFVAMSSEDSELAPGDSKQETTSTLRKQKTEVLEVSNTSASGRTMSRASSTVSIQSLDDSGLSRGDSKVCEYGTPILEASTSVSILPSTDKFKQGTEEHLLFENLPGSTGTFTRMRNLIKTIKSKLKK